MIIPVKHKWNHSISISFEHEWESVSCPFGSSSHWLSLVFVNYHGLRCLSQPLNHRHEEGKKRNCTLGLGNSSQIKPTLRLNKLQLESIKSPTNRDRVPPDESFTCHLSIDKGSLDRILIYVLITSFIHCNSILGGCLLQLADIFGLKPLFNHMCVEDIKYEIPWFKIFLSSIPSSVGSEAK